MSRLTGEQPLRAVAVVLCGDVERDAFKHWMDGTEVEFRRRVPAEGGRGLHEEGGLKRAVHHEAWIFLDFGRVGLIVMNPVGVERDGLVAKEQCLGHIFLVGVTGMAGIGCAFGGV
ncbi:MAG: hypothetical protein GDA40_11990 [Rhodobacteraceae bacterium]|nr:hypothetical protein [Paracoccaceae bacterium]